MNDGRSFERHVVTPLGSPGNALSADAQRQKAQFCFELGGLNRSADALFDAAARLDRLDVAASLFEIVTQ